MTTDVGVLSSLAGLGNLILGHAPTAKGGWAIFGASLRDLGGGRIKIRIKDQD